MDRLLKKEIKEKVVPAKVMSSRLWRLTIQYCRILDRAEKLDAKDIPIADAKAILRIEDELRKRLIKAIGHDFYPPAPIEAKEIPKTKLELSVGRKIKFPVTVTSSLGTKVASFSVEASTKIEADMQAPQMIRSMGLKRVSHKLS